MALFKSAPWWPYRFWNIRSWSFSPPKWVLLGGGASWTVAKFLLPDGCEGFVWGWWMRKVAVGAAGTRWEIQLKCLDTLVFEAIIASCRVWFTLVVTSDIQFWNNMLEAIGYCGHWFEYGLIWLAEERSQVLALLWWPFKGLSFCRCRNGIDTTAIAWFTCTLEGFDIV